MDKRMIKVPTCDGFVRNGFEHVKEVFRSRVESGVERGGSFAAYYKGELVVNLWGGFADEECNRHWTDNTTSNFYSCTKSVAALVIAHLVDRGLVTYDQPVSSYWPEFAENGKENITLKHILSMRAGLSLLSEPFKLSSMRDDPLELERLLAQQKPWDLGEAAAYSPVVVGLYLDCIVRRVDPKKRSLAHYFREEIAQPFDVDFHIGTPKWQFWRKARQVVVVRGQAYKQYQLGLLSNPAIHHHLLATSATQPADFLRNAHINNPHFAELPCPSSHGVGPAAGLAKLHGILANGGCTLDGRRLLSQQALQKLQTPVYMGPERLFGSDVFYSYGMTLLPVLEGGKLHFCLGHGGFGGQYSAADPKHRTGWAYCSNYLDPTLVTSGTAKWVALEEALFQSVLLLEGGAVPRRHLSDRAEVQRHRHRFLSQL